jgi:hypothetical protein
MAVSVPKPDSCTAAKEPSFDHLVGPAKQRDGESLFLRAKPFLAPQTERRQIKTVAFNPSVP